MLANFRSHWVMLAILATLGSSIHLQDPEHPHIATVQQNRSIRQWGFVDGSSFTEAEDLVASIASGGVWMKSKPLRPANATSLIKYESKYGFYMHTFSDGEACIHLLREVRRVYPNEPIYIMSDGGMNFSNLCDELGKCEFSWKPGANDRWNPMPFFRRFQEAARRLKTKFIVMLEPDNELRQKLVVDPPYDAGGLNDTNPAFHQRMVDYVEAQGKKYSGNKNFSLLWHRFGLAGGSYFSSEAVLEAFDPDDVDWHMLRSLDNKRVWSSDVAMPLALAVHGYTYYPWEEITQQRFGLSDKAALRHYGRDEVKPHYGVRLTEQDQKLVTFTKLAHKDVTCQGCVWTSSDDVCLAKKPIQCPITGHDLGPPASWKPANKRKPAKQ